MRPWSIEDISLVSCIKGRVTIEVRIPIFSVI